MFDKKPNILFIMTDQQRFDTIAALGNSLIYTPNLDRLARRGIAFTNAYSTCPVCVPARYTIHTGCEPMRTGVWVNGPPKPHSQQPQSIEDRCGPYLARVMRQLGYRTFGIGKFHTMPDWDEDLGYDVHMHTEEIYLTDGQRKRDAYASFIAREHPQYDFIEQLHGERANMYYVPQTSALPAELTVEAFVADRAIEQIRTHKEKPWFGFVSFIGPHPPFAPPIPYSRMYNPEQMSAPVCGHIETDLMDEQLPWMNYAVWAEGISLGLAKNLKSRYYGEITYIDACIGKILDAVELQPDPENTLICFFSDHGDHLGDHHAWQKESFFEGSCRVPFLLSWPAVLPQNRFSDELVCLTDLFGVATAAAGQAERRDGIDILSMLNGNSKGREHLFGYYGQPGTELFKVMVRWQKWKYIYLSNGGREQLFDLQQDPKELRLQVDQHSDIAAHMKHLAVEALRGTPWDETALLNGTLREFPFRELKRIRINQFDYSRGISDFPRHPGDMLKETGR